MSNLSLRHIYKVYSNGCKAVNDFNMEIEDKEFIVFVGPSGCGKSTTLRMIAGLEEISAGELYIDDILVNDMEPKDRDISMVFQNYALYPHMTVYDNMAFGLKLRHVPQEEIHKKVLWAAQVLKLTDYLDRKPRAMSGGQRQRVALGRAILRNPKVFLLDEPLSNLDAKLRTEMRAEITKLHQTLGTTFIYVTHDQVEAMTLGSRVVVMKLGYVQQIDTPQNLYNYPTNKFVAGFIGTPQMNFFETTLLRNGDKVQIKFENCGAEFTTDFINLIKVRPSYLKGNKKVTVGLRCENISIDPEVIAKSNNVIKVKVSHFEELGSETLVYGDLNMEGDGFEENNTRVIIKARNKGDLVPGQIIDAAFDMSTAHFFDIDTEESIAPRIPSENVFDSKVSGGKLEFLGTNLVLPQAIKCDDVDGIELFVPTDAISFNGDIKAKVVNVEVINKKQIIHLEINGRVFFAISDEEVEVGKTVNISIDLRKIHAVKDEKEIISALQMNNTFIGAYTNAQNNARSVKTIEKFYSDKANEEISKLVTEKNLEIGKLGLNDMLLKEYKKELAQKKEDAKAELSLQLGTLDLGKEGKQKVKKECKEKIAAAEEEYNAKVAEYKKLRSSVSQTDELKAKAKEIEDSYNAKIAAIKDVLSARISEFEAGKDAAKPLFIESNKASVVTLKQATAELDKKHDLILQDYSAKINASQNSEEIAQLKHEVAEINEKYLKDKDDLVSTSKDFFININGHYVKSDYKITKKIVQALGISIFNVNYRFQLGLDSTIISNEGFDAVVKEILDYGDAKYVVAMSHDERIVVKADKEYAVGDVLKIKFDINNIHVYENKLDIILY